MLSFFADLHDIVYALQRVQHEHDSAVDHVSFVEREIVDIVWDEGAVCDAECLEHGLLPEAAAAFDGSEGVDDTEG